MLCSRENGGEQGGCALQRQGRGEEKGSCFGAPDCALQHQGGWGEEGGCALQRHMHGSILASRPGKKTQSAPRCTMGKLKAHLGALWENTERTQTKLTGPLRP